MKRFIAKVVIPVALVLCILFSLPLACGHEHAHSHHNGHEHAHSHTPGHAHSHSHEHAHHHHHELHGEPPAYRWSKQANEQYEEADEHLDEHPAHKWSQEANEIRENEASESSKKSEQASKNPQKSSVWLEAICATLAISIAPYLILFIIPVTNSKEHEPYLKVLLAFASGGLLGDAFLHLIPHALIAQSSSGGHTHSHSHSHEAGTEGGHGGHDISIGLAVLGGIIAFLVVEKFVRIFKGGHMHSHSHSHSHTHKSEANGGGKSDGEKHKKNGEKSGEKHKNGEKNDEKQKGDKKKGSKNSNNQGDIKVAGYLNLAADFTHNLTDGLAIGASFLAGKSVGVVTTLTIFLHEIPHEIGDFAILLQSGCTRRKAMMLQLVTALGALTGTFISLLAEGADESAISWILPFTAGGFIYIATVSVIPELLENTRFWQSIFEVVALLSGVALMMGIAHLEEMGHEH